MKQKIPKTEEEWRKKLNTDQFYILRTKGTEPAFTGKYLNNKEIGVYACAGCGAALFSSKTKFNSRTGWPSFFDTISKNNIEKKPDNSFLVQRIEVACKKCGSHLGHVFPDGPKPTGLRYCINSLALNFKKGKEKSEKF